MLSAAQMAQMSQLLETALELDAVGRRSWLEALAPEYRNLLPALRRALLPEGDEGLDSGELPNFAAALQTESVGSGLQPGETVGPYRLIRPLGTGGMAEVWLAQRADGTFKREVALKLPLLFRVRKDLVTRFERERDILAALEHPNIGRLYDAGVSGDGLPYLAMEYVVGKPFTTYCDDHRLSIRARLELFEQVLTAVRYAHANLVIHRDIKPSNILVTEVGQVHLLDFGIAKILSEGEAKETQLTRLAGRALTPDYAAPEQIAGAPITTAADVYALGVVLYELLTGERPYRLKRDSLGALEEAILQTEPILPSRVEPSETSAKARATTTSKLPKVLTGDLDAITMKALRKSPSERYGTASEFAEDVARFLRGDVVLAQPDSAAYRAVKFVRRHRVGVATISALVLTLAGGFAATSYEARVADLQRDAALQAQRRSAQEARIAEETTDFMVNLFHVVDPSEARGNSITAREILDGAAVRLQTQLATQPMIQARLLRTIGIVYDNLGLHGKSKALLQEALRIESAISKPDETEIARTKAALGGAVLGHEDFVGGEALLTDAIRYFDTKSELAGESAQARGTLAWLYFLKSDFVSARRVGEEALRRGSAAFGHKSDAVADILDTLGSTMTGMGDPAGALPLLEEAAGIRKDLFGDQYPWYARDLEQIGRTLQALERNVEARGYFESSIKIYERVLGPEHPELASGLEGLGWTELQLGQYGDAEKSLTRALKIEEESVGPNTTVVAYTLSGLGRAYGLQGDLMHAEPLLRRSIAIEHDHLPDQAHYYIAGVLELGLAQRRAGRLPEALATLRMDLAESNRLGVSGQGVMSVLAMLADVLCYRAPAPEGYAISQRALALSGTAPNAMMAAAVRSVAAVCDGEASRYDENRKVLEDSLATIEQIRGPSAPQTKDAQRRLATFLRNGRPHSKQKKLP